MVMRGGRVLVGGMALQADAVAGQAKLGGMRFMTIAAGDPGREHLALLERAIIVDLVEHLSVGLIEPVGKQRDRVRIGKRPTGDPILGKLGASRMAQAASLDLLANERGPEVADRLAGGGIGRPADTLPLIETN